LKHNIHFDDDSRIKTTEKRSDNVNKMRLNDDIRKEKRFIFWIELRQIEDLNKIKHQTSLTKYLQVSNLNLESQV
jgi:hypothetical protein